MAVPYRLPYRLVQCVCGAASSKAGGAAASGGVVVAV